MRTDASYTAKFKNATLEDVPGEVQRQTDFTFVYSTKDVEEKNLSKTKHNTSYMKYDWNFYMIVLPIPKKEMDANANMKQNPGYGS